MIYHLCVYIVYGTGRDDDDTQSLGFYSTPEGVIAAADTFMSAESKEVDVGVEMKYMFTAYRGEINSSKTYLIDLVEACATQEDKDLANSLIYIENKYRKKVLN
jgi:hypothetical protein